MNWMAGLVLVLGVALATDADASRRLGSGKSIGQQSSQVSKREADPKPANAPQQGQTAAQPAAPGAAGAASPAVAASPKPWGGVLGGVAAGLGLVWLAHSLGLGEAFGQILLVGLMVMAGILLFTLLRRARSPAMAQLLTPGGGPVSAPRPMPVAYSPDKVGNDASARPWERSSMAFEAGRYADARAGVQIGSALGTSGWGIPAGFDVNGFVANAKRNFITLQDAWDRADIQMLRSMMTDQMMSEIQSQLAERERELGGRPNRTEVVMLDAQLLGIEDLGQGYMASVEFSGMIREDLSSGPSPFREVWNMTKPSDGSTGWLVAGVQALQ